MNNLADKKRSARIYSVIFSAVLWLMFGGFCLGQTAPPKSDVVHIVSDRLEAYQLQRQIVFIDNVVARQGELTIRGDQMTIFYREKGNPESDDEDLGGRIDRIVVEGSVRITQKKVIATGEHAVYFKAENKLVLTGQPRVEQGKDFIQGEKITLFLDTEKSIVEGGPSGPVEATIYSSARGGPVDRGSTKGVGSSGKDRQPGG